MISPYSYRCFALLLFLSAAARATGTDGLQVQDRDDFANNTAANYKVEGNISWLPGRAVFGSGAKLSRAIPLGTVTEMRTAVRFSPDETKSAGGVQLRIEGEGVFSAIALRVADHKVSLVNLEEPKEIVDLTTMMGNPNKADERWNLRFEVRYGVARAKAWSSTTAEPQDWMTSRYSGATIWEGNSVAIVAENSSGVELELLEVRSSTRMPIQTDDQRQKVEQINTLRAQIVALQKQSQYSDAIEQGRTVLALCTEVYGEKSIPTALALAELGYLLEESGEWEESRRQLEKGIETYKGIFGDEHPDTALAIGFLGMLFEALGKYKDAEIQHRQAYEIRRMTLGDEHAKTANSLGNLGRLASTNADYAAARHYLQTALAIRQKQDDPRLEAAVLNDLGFLFHWMGDHASAESYYQRALEKDESSFGPEHPNLANKLNNLAAVLMARRDFSAAKATYLKALAITQKHSFMRRYTALCLHNLGVLHFRMGECEASHSYYEQALSIELEVLGADHSELAIIFKNYGALLAAIGETAAAQQQYEKALAIYEKEPGRLNHPSRALTLMNLGLLHDGRGDHDRAEELFRSALAILQRNLQDTFAGASDRQRIGLLNMHRLALDTYLSAMRAEVIAADEKYAHVLDWKGAVVTRQIEEQAARDQPQLRTLIEQINVIRAQLVAPVRGVDNNWVREVESLRERKESLERELAHRSADIRRELEINRVTPSALRSRLPTDVALVDYVEYSHVKSVIGVQGPPLREQRILAFVVRPNQALRCVPLGLSTPIEDAVRTWREKVRSASAADLEPVAAEIKRLIWEPLEKHLNGVNTVLVAPDGTLCRIPFAALPGKRKGSYLIEDSSISYVTSGRHAFECFSERPAVQTTGILAIGGIQYGSTSATANPSLAARTRAAPLDDEVRDGFKDLPETKDEAIAAMEAFKRSFPQKRSTLLAEDAPNENRVKIELQNRWRVVHIAGHGFFASSSTPSALGSGRLSDQDAVSAATESVIGLHPLLLCGIPLSGASRPASNWREKLSEDGVLTAEEVAGLDMRGTSLVVLSGCETGLGEVAGGEGVLGLQRSFAVAGTHTLVASLWKVDSRMTLLLMREFHNNLWGKQLSKLEALREAQLYVLNRGPADSRHPYYWAAWVLSGDPREERLP